MSFGKPVRRRLDEDQRVLPLINVVFLLLIFFMVAGQLSKSDPVRIEPPVSESEKEPGETRVQILMRSDGGLLIAGRETGIDELGARIAAAIGSRADKTVHVKADGGADAAAVIAVLDTVKAAGAEKVKLLTSKRRGP